MWKGTKLPFKGFEICTVQWCNFGFINTKNKLRINYFDNTYISPIFHHNKICFGNPKTTHITTKGYFHTILVFPFRVVLFKGPSPSSDAATLTITLIFDLFDGYCDGQKGLYSHFTYQSNGIHNGVVPCEQTLMFIYDKQIGWTQTSLNNVADRHDWAVGWNGILCDIIFFWGETLMGW